MTAEERFVKPEEHLLVQAELVARIERRVDAFIERTDRRLELDESQLDSHAHEMAEFRATVARVLEMLERFVSGRAEATDILKTIMLPITLTYFLNEFLTQPPADCFHFAS